MLTPLTHALSAAEGLAGRTKSLVKQRLDLWDHVHVRPFVAWGTQREVRFLGCVHDDPPDGTGDGASRLDSARLTLRRLASHTVPHATVRLTLAGQRLETETDRDGLFDAVMTLEAPLAGGPWFDAEARVLDPVYSPPARVPVLIPTPEAAFGVITDLDDTLLGGRLSRSRGRAAGAGPAAFPGIGPFLRALLGGASGASGPDARGDEDARGTRPLVYLSSAPWSLQAEVAEVLRERGLPRGALVLHGMGTRPGTRSTSAPHLHKLEWISTILGTTPDLPFVLVGGGPTAPELYQEVVRRYPGQVRAVFVWAASDGTRDRDVTRLARDVEARGVPMRLVGSAADAAEAAAALGLVASSAVEAVRRASRDERAAEIA